MAGKGAPPKLHPVRDAAGDKHRPDLRRISPDGSTRGPELPPWLDWPDPTVVLYDALRRDAIAADLTPADWSHVIDTMLLHRRYWSDPDGPSGSRALGLAGEIRLRLAQLGVTPEARLRLRLMVDPPRPPTKLEQLRARR